jgi:hypothetical protein
VTLEQLQAEREKLLGSLSAPDSLTFADRSMRNRTPEQIRAAIAQIDGEIGKLQTPEPRQFVVQTKRGLD